MTAARARVMLIHAALATGGMDLLREGRGDDHDRLVADTVKGMEDLEAIVPERAVLRLKEIVP